MKNAPCRNCTDRTVGCHGKCTRYEDWKIERAAELDYTREKNAVHVSDNLQRTHWRNMRYGKNGINNGRKNR